MKKKEIKIIIEGMPEDSGLLRVNAFISELDAITKNISKMANFVSGNGASSFYLRISNLSYESPATVVLEAIPQNPEIDLRDMAIQKFYSTYHSIESDSQENKKIEYGLIEGLIETTSIIGKSINSARIITDGYDLNLTKEFKAKLDLILAPEEKAKGFIRGMLEYINIHGGQNVFKIYPDVGPIKITCHFPPELTKTAIRAIGNYVEVKGELKYRAVSNYAHEISVEEIEIFSSDEDLPSLYNLRGIAPKLTGKLSSEEFIRKIRNEAIS
jgi:hypothetical protein